MDIMRIAAVGIVGCILAVLVKEYKPELGICVAIITGLVIFSFSVKGIFEAFGTIQNIVQTTNIDKRYFDAIIKVTGVAYITEYGAEICKDCGHGSIAVKVELAGKICIMLFTIPIIQAFLQVCIEAVKFVW